MEPADTIDVGPCLTCGRRNPSDARFCAACGHPLGTAEVPELEAASVADPLIGRVIADRYRIVSLLGRGGMGVVYKAEHVHIGKLMAVKLLHGELSRDKDTIKRFRREAEAASKLSHVNSVQIFDFGSSQGMMYLVMEYVDGHDFGHVITRDGPLSFARTARICAQVCASVAEAHAQGIVHRDLKPENIMITSTRSEDDVVKVLDFGLAKLREEGQGSNTVTRAGHIVGTPYYMSPEQIRGEEVDGRGDIYAIGAIIYRACTGVLPYAAPTPMGVLTKHLTEVLVPPSSRAEHPLPPELDGIVLRAMAKAPEDRFASAEELREALFDVLRAQGEDLGPAAPSGLRSDSYSLESSRVVPVATRGDVDAYERSLARRGWFGRGALLLLALGLALGGWLLYGTHRAPALATREQEPNNEPSEANDLPAGTRVTGYLGKRWSRERSDADVYRLDLAPGGHKVMRLEVGPIPNMNIAVDVVKKGRSAPLLVADSGGVGAPERIPNFPLTAATYYLRVRENWGGAAFPTENVSDPYTIQVSVTDPEEGFEREVNDTLELATKIAPGGEVRGYIGWKGDRDDYCLDRDAKSVTVELSAVPEIDLTLRLVHQARGRSLFVNEHGVGEGEAKTLEAPGVAGETCFEVAATGDGSGADARETYRLRVTAGVP